MEPGGGEGGRTVVSVAESESFLPASLFIHSSLGSVEEEEEDLVLLMPGTTRGMVVDGWMFRIWVLKSVNSGLGWGFLKLED